MQITNAAECPIQSEHMPHTWLQDFEQRLCPGLWDGKPVAQVLVSDSKQD